MALTPQEQQELDGLLADKRAEDSRSAPKRWGAPNQVESDTGPMLTEAQPTPDVVGEQQDSRRFYTPEMPALAPQRRGVPGEPPISPNVVRYGVPITAGIIAGGLTGGSMGLPAALAVNSFVTGLTGGASERLAQTLEGKPADYKKVASAAILNFTPALNKGGFLARFAFNTVSNIGTNEASRFILDDNTNKNSLVENSVYRFGAPTVIAAGTSYLSRFGARTVLAETNKAAKQAERYGSTVMLSEVLPGYETFEAGRVASRNARALNSLQNMDANIGEVVAREFPEAPDIRALSDDLSQKVSLLSETQAQWRKASVAAAETESAYQAAKAANSANAPALLARAKEAAMEVTKAETLHLGGASTMFGGQIPDFGEIALGARSKALSEMAATTNEAVKAQIRSLYAAAGIGPNQPVVSLGDILQELKSVSGKGGAFEGNELNAAARALFTKAFGKGATNESTITLEKFRLLQDDISEGLVRPGRDIHKAERDAANMYNVVRAAADKYLQGSNPEQFAAWKTAQLAAAANFAASRGGAIKMLAKGDVDGFYSLVKSQGKGQAMDEIAAYKNVIASTGDPAVAVSAANAFEANVYKSLRDAAVDEATKGGRASGLARDWRMIDFGSLAKEMQALETKGIPAASLGMGTPSQIGILARLASKSGGVTVEEFGDLLKKIPQVGVDLAYAKTLYAREVTKSLIGQGAQKAGDTAARLKRLATEARVGAREAMDIYEKANANPLVRFLDGTKAKLSNDPAGNAQWVSRILATDEATASGIMSALRASGRGQDAQRLSEAASANVMRKFGSLANGEEGKLDLQSIYDFFRNKSAENQRAVKTFAALVGPEKMALINKNFVNPIEDILKQNNLMGVPMDAGRLLHQARFKTLGGASGAPSVYGSLGQFVDLAKSGWYNLLDTLYLNPKTAPAFAKAGYVIDKFVASSPVNAMYLRLAMEQDAKQQ